MSSGKAEVDKVENAHLERNKSGDGKTSSANGDADDSAGNGACAKTALAEEVLLAERLLEHALAKVAQRDRAVVREGWADLVGVDAATWASKG